MFQLHKSNNCFDHSRGIIASIWLFLIFISLFSGCVDKPGKKEKSNLTDAKNDEFPIMGKGSTTPFIKGTFVYFGGKDDWDFNKWDAHMKEMKEIGIETLIIQYSAYNESLWCNSENNYSSSKHVYALPTLLKAAGSNQMSVYVGLYFNEEFWSNTTNEEILNIHAQRSINLAKEIWDQYRDYTSFKGWYICHEPAPYYYSNEDNFKILKNSLVNPIADYCKSISDLPVAIAPFFNYNLSSSSVFSTFMKRLGSCNLDIIIVQDGIGVDHCTLNELEEYYAAGNRGLYEDGNFKGAFWADIETFTQLPDSFIPESFDIVQQKLEIVDDHVSNIVIYQYYSNMCPDGPNKDSAKTLRDNYLNYITSKPKNR